MAMGIWAVSMRVLILCRAPRPIVGCGRADRGAKLRVPWPAGRGLGGVGPGATNVGGQTQAAAAGVGVGMSSVCVRGQHFA